jgi:hypothetical protein
VTAFYEKYDVVNQGNSEKEVTSIDIEALFDIKALQVNSVSGVFHRTPLELKSC